MASLARVLAVLVQVPGTLIGPMGVTACRPRAGTQVRAVSGGAVSRTLPHCHIMPCPPVPTPAQTAALGFLMGALYSIEISLLFVTSFILGAVLCRVRQLRGKHRGKVVESRSAVFSFRPPQVFNFQRHGRAQWKLRQSSRVQLRQPAVQAQPHIAVPCRCQHARAAPTLGPPLGPVGCLPAGAWGGWERPGLAPMCADGAPQNGHHAGGR